MMLVEKSTVKAQSYYSLILIVLLSYPFAIV